MATSVTPIEYSPAPGDPKILVEHVVFPEGTTILVIESIPSSEVTDETGVEAVYSWSCHDLRGASGAERAYNGDHHGFFQHLQVLCHDAPTNLAIGSKPIRLVYPAADGKQQLEEAQERRALLKAEVLLDVTRPKRVDPLLESLVGGSGGEIERW